MCEATALAVIVINAAFCIAGFRRSRRFAKMETECAAQYDILRTRWLARLTEADALRTESRRLRDEWKAAKMGLPAALTDCLNGDEE